MLVIGPSLPVVQYLWSMSRPSQPLPSTDSSASESLLQTLSPGPHDAMRQCTGTCALGVGISGCHLAHQTTAKKSIERHGGILWVESIYGAGLTFYFTTPGSVTR